MNINFIVVLLVIIITECCGKPLDSWKDATILRYENDLGENGMYKFSFESSDGTLREESGSVQQKGPEEVLVVKGSYSFLDDKGERHDVNYISDDLGYRIVKFPTKTAPPRIGSYGAPAVRIDPSVLGSLVGSGVG